MNKELVVKKCLKCGELVIELKHRSQNVICCGEPMVTLVPNSVDASFEKHVPTYEVEGNMLKVKVNHVMEEDHYIEWILVANEEQMLMKKLHPGEKAEFECENIENAVIYAFCNKHDLWKTEVK